MIITKLIKKENNTKTDDSCCPIEHAMHTIGKRWTALIIRDLAQGTKRYCELERSLTNISPRILSQRLSELENTEIIERKVIAEMPVRVEYSLTKKGTDLIKVIDSMATWGKKWHKRGK